VPLRFIQAAQLERETVDSCSSFYAYSIIICCALASLAAVGLSHAAQQLAHDMQKNTTHVNGSTTAEPSHSFFPDCDPTFFFMTFLGLMLSDYKHSVLLHRLKKVACCRHLLFLLGKAGFDHGIVGLLCVMHCVNPDQMPEYLHGLIACWIVSECVMTTDVDAFNPRVLPVVSVSCRSAASYLSPDLWSRSALVRRTDIPRQDMAPLSFFFALSGCTLASIVMLSASFACLPPIMMYAYSCLGQMEGNPNHFLAWMAALTSYAPTFLRWFRLFQPGKRSVRRVIALLAQGGQNICGGVAACMSPFPWMGLFVVTLMHIAACRPAHDVFLPAIEEKKEARPITLIQEVEMMEIGGSRLGKESEEEKERQPDSDGFFEINL